MPCYVKKTDDGTTFICGEFGGHCSICADAASILCDFPVGDGKTCDRNLCENHANLIGNDLHYCVDHYQEWRNFVDSGGVSKNLKNVIAIGSEKGGGE